MRVMMVTYGTEGDTRPQVMLARGLLDAGHQVSLLAEQQTLATAAQLGVPHTALAGAIDDEVDALVGQGNSLRAASRGLARMARRLSAAWVAQADTAAAGCDVVLAGGLAAFIGISVAERHRIPVVGTGTVPVTPTGDFPSTFLPPGPWPRWLNRPSHVLATRQIWQQFRRPLNAARAQQLGLPPQPQPPRDAPFLYGFSPSLLPAPADWPGNHVVCGQWRLPGSAQALPASLQQWLAMNPAPVFIGFGSMRGFDRQQVFGGLIAALGNRPILLSPGWAGLPEGWQTPAHVQICPPVPHEALFPHCALVIHHGGSGTTHSASRAGVPQLVLPMVADQPFWAQRLFQRGVAGPPLSLKRFDRATLQRAIAHATAPDTVAHAHALGQAMALEDGVATAVGALEAWLAR
jgi:sterol 3beta-glucosyltransferase